MATIKQIAKLAGVSIGTVDRVLHERGGLAPDTKARVQAAIEELGYVPNQTAPEPGSLQEEAAHPVLYNRITDLTFFSCSQ